jgi:ubiquinone/menaquinone biosynthesis C-methylase UbiE
MSNMSFRGMSLWLKAREWFGNPRQRLEEAGLERGQAVLDYGCGIGSYAIPAAQIVGDGGVVYALDIHPLAVETVARRADKENLANVETIQSDRDTGLNDESVDAILLYDVLHSVPDKGALLCELYRVLKPGGSLSVVPDHMEEDVFLETVQAGNLFSLQARNGKVYWFSKCPNGKHEPER